MGGRLGKVGRFRLLGRIALGGMAEIFLARPDDPDKTDAGGEVVIKVILPAFRTKTDFLTMFKDEAKLASLLDNPNIVRIVEVGEHTFEGTLGKSRAPFIAMEHLRGVNLRELQKQLRNQSKKLPVQAGALILAGALRGLSHAHEFRNRDGEPLHIVHRDVSPQNIIVTYDGAVKLLDFGVAKAQGRLHETRAGLIKGKFAYMSPEQIEGKELDARSDLFSLAETVYELMLRRHPYYADADMEVLRKVLEEDPPHPCDVDPDFPRPLADVLMKALSKGRSARYESAKVMLRALTSWLNSSEDRFRSTDMAHFVRSTMQKRLRAEEDARRIGDEKALVKILQVGSAKTPDDEIEEASFENGENTDQTAPNDGALARPHRPDSVQVIPASPSQVQRGVLIRRQPLEAVTLDEENGAKAMWGNVEEGVQISFGAIAEQGQASGNAATLRDEDGQNQIAPRSQNHLNEPHGRSDPSELRRPDPRLAPDPVDPQPPPSEQHIRRWRVDVAVFAGGVLALAFAIGLFLVGSAPRHEATLHIVSVPEGAEVFLNGRLQAERTPTELHPSPGENLRIEVVGPKGRCIHDVEVARGQTRIGCRFRQSPKSSG